MVAAALTMHSQKESEAAAASSTVAPGGQPHGVRRQPSQSTRIRPSEMARKAGAATSRRARRMPARYVAMSSGCSCRAGRPGHHAE